jgi:GH25 family lysozyme M1 (1,4-beta-N-acetylmuramidase)/uncharacterized protein YjdB
MKTDDINNNNDILDDDDKYIVAYRTGDFVLEEYEPEDVAEEVEQSESGVYYEDIDLDDNNKYYESDDSDDEDDDDPESYYEDIGETVEDDDDPESYYEDIDEIDEDTDDIESYYEDIEGNDEIKEDADETENYYADIDDIEESKDSSDEDTKDYKSEEYSDDLDDEDAFEIVYKDSNGEYDDYDEFEEDDDNNNEEGIVGWFKNAVKSLTVFDLVLGGTGIVVAVAVIVIISMFFQTKSTDKQAAAIVPLGEELSEIGIVGSEGLLAMSGSVYDGVFDNLVADDEEISTVDVSDDATATKVSVSFTSVEKDLKIRFTDANTGALITGTVFEVTLTNSKGNKTVLTDDDMDGIIYAQTMTAGTYDVVITSTDKYKFPTTAQQVTVKDKVQYVVVNNIQDEVKTEKQVNVAVEDTQINNAAQEEETLKDTVEWVAESKTPVGGSESYLLVDKTTIADPSQTSSLAYRMLFDAFNITLNETSVSLKVGTETSLSTSYEKKENTDSMTYSYTTSWVSSDENIASVNSDGKVVAKAVGKATITCKVTETIVEKGKTTTDVVEKEISVDDYNNKISEDEQFKDKCKEKFNEDGEIIAYTYEESVEKQGEDITTINEGTKTCDVTVEATAPTLTSTTLELKKSADSCTVGATLTVSPSKVTYTYSDNTTKSIDSGFPTVKWSSADTSIATVNDSGVVTGVKAGKTKIKGTIEGDGGTSTEIDVEIIEAKDLTLALDRTSEVYIAVGGTTTLVATVGNYKSDSGVTWATSNSKVATVDDKGTVTGVSAGSVTITATTKEKNKDGKNLTATCVVTVNSNAMNDKVTKLKDKNGNQIYVKNSDGTYVEAVYADYYTASEFYIKTDAKYTYTGWQTIDGKTYYYDKNGNPVTGTQIINGVTYNFGTDGAIASSVNGSTFGIDVSRHNGTIDWNAVKASGVDFVIIRCGYRGSSTGALIEDQNFKTNIKGATAAGLKVGVYVFSQAINEVEAVKEASLAVSLVKGYNLTYPIFIDTESSGGRADSIDKATRTAVVNAFCQTVATAGYKPGIYASKTWFEGKLNMSSIGNYKIWLAQYASTPTYKSKYDMWQYSSKGKISGINGNVDLNYSYLGY